MRSLWWYTCGGFSRGMMKSTLIGWRSASGGSPFAISIAVIPRDHISACVKQSSKSYQEEEGDYGQLILPDHENSDRYEGWGVGDRGHTFSL